MTYSRQALITKRAKVLIEAASPEDADHKFHAGEFVAEGAETVAWEADGELVLEDDEDGRSESAA